LRTLALIGARIGKKEMEEREEERASSSLNLSPRRAIQELLAEKIMHKKAPKEAFMALMNNPAEGFSSFQMEDGTQVGFFPNPNELGSPWSGLIADRWAHGLGLVLFQKEAKEACGMVFLHGLGRVSWSKIRRDAWQASGGTMAFPSSKLSFAQALVRVVDKGVAMTLKWRAIDHALELSRHAHRTELGGSKGIVLHGNGETAKADAMEAYAHVIQQLGVTLTGSDEGVTPQWATFLAERAPRNIVGNQASIYRGREPTQLTGDGVFSAIEAVSRDFFGGSSKEPTLAQGFGGVGSRVAELMQHSRYPMDGLVEINGDALLRSRGKKVKAALYLDQSDNGVSALRAMYYRLRGIRMVNGLADAVLRHPSARILSPNGGPHPITFEVAEAMILSGIRVVVGAANNQAAFDRNGSPDSIAWILQAAGIFHPTDFVVNRMGATAVVADAVQIPHSDLSRMANGVGESVTTEADAGYRRGIPPAIFSTRRYERDWNGILSSGRGMGGKF